MENEREINGTFWDTRIFYKVSHIFEAWLMMSTTWSRQHWERKWLCFTQESVSFFMTNREEIGKDKASGGTSKPQNHLKCSERRLRNKVDDLAQSFMHYMYFNNRVFFKFHHCFSNTNAFENSWASAHLHTLKVMSTLRKILWDSLVSEKCSSKKVFLKPKIFILFQMRLGRNFAIDSK